MRLSRILKAHHVEEATRYDSNSNSCLLDLILTRYEDNVAKPPIGKSDHASLVFNPHVVINNDLLS